jgi:uncharacterized Zn finger protein (UPF0148 family)
MGCGGIFASGQYWQYCGETDFEQTGEVLCKRCGGTCILEEDKNIYKEELVKIRESIQDYYNKMKKYENKYG